MSFPCCDRGFTARKRQVLDYVKGKQHRIFDLLLEHSDDEQTSRIADE